MDLITTLVLVIAGILGGVATGLIGASTATVMAPIFILFLKMDPYVAIGLSVSADVCASIVGGRIYYKNGNVALKKTAPLIIFCLLGVIIGSSASKTFPVQGLTFFAGFGALLSGSLFIFEKPKKPKKYAILERLKSSFKKYKFTWLSIIGLIIGLDIGLFGSGGGLMILLVLVFVLGYEMHHAVGTSIVIMIIMAFSSGALHYYFEPFNWKYLLIVCGWAFLGSRYASIFANEMSEKSQKKIAGWFLAILGIVSLTKLFFF